MAALSLTRAQTVRIVVIGSSTAYGMGTSDYAGLSTPPNSWVGRLQAAFRRNTNDNRDTVIDNLALPGFTTFQTRETGFVPPADKPSPDPSRNITKALSLNPDVVLINLPSNDVNSGYSTKVTMDNYRAMVEQLKNAGKKFFVLSTSPRDDAWWGPERRQQIREQTDSIMLNFPGRSIRIWENLATPDYFRKPEVKSLLDDVHFNDFGHSLIFNNVMAANIFGPDAPLPVQWINFTASTDNDRILLEWQTASENHNSHFLVERSADGQTFSMISQVESQGNGNMSKKYRYTDLTPLDGQNFYRLTQVDLDQKKSSSKIISAILHRNAQSMPRLYPVPASSVLNIKLDCLRHQQVQITITDMQGRILNKYVFSTVKGSNLFSLPVNALQGGNYCVFIRQESGTTKQYFSKL